MARMSDSHENYIETIIMLGGTTQIPVRSVDIAAKLDVSKASVNKAISALKDAGMVNHSYYGDVTLTPAGYSYGEAVLERHRMMTLFLTKVIGIPEDRAEEEGCAMEHAISDESYEMWLDYIRGLDLCPVMNNPIEDDVK